MSRYRIIGCALLIALCALLCATSLSGYKFMTRNSYHRSRMFEYQLLWQISMVLPVGTKLDDFLREFGLGKEAYTARGETSGYVSIKPTLDIPVEEQRDYSGFSFYFENNLLTSFAPNGPQPADRQVELDKTPIGKRIGKYQPL